MTIAKYLILFLWASSAAAQIASSGTGVASIDGVGVSSPPNVLTFNTTSVPNGTQNAVYSSFSFSISGGTAPYACSLYNGSPLPSGMTLTSCALGGTPTGTGSTTFWIKVTDSASPQNAAYSLPITITINSSTLAVTLTSPLPSGTQSTPYSVNLTATGGVPCSGGTYTWTVFSGTLPTGLSISGQQITGTPTGTGTSTFVLQAADCNTPTPNTALSVSLSLTVNSGSTCGPPNYSCANTTTSVIQTPSVPPQVGPHVCTAGSLTSCGNLTGANTVVTDPQFGTSILRLTDASLSNNTFQATSGSSDENKFNTDSTMLVLRKSGGGNDVFWGLNPSTLQGAPMYGSTNPGGLTYSGDAQFSFLTRTTAYLFPAAPSTAIQTLDFSNCVTLGCGSATAPTAQPFADFASSTNCVGGGFGTVTWTSIGGLNGNDTAFGMAFSNNGGQGGIGAHYVCGYVVGKGYIRLDTVTGAIIGDSGFAGGAGLTCSPGCTGSAAGWAAAFPSGFTVHNVKMYKGTSDVITIVACQGSTPGCGIANLTQINIFWQIGTTNWFNVTSSIGGHFANGDHTWSNAPSTMKFAIRQFNTPGTVSFVTPGSASGSVQQHAGWVNADSLDSLPFFGTAYDANTYTGFTAPYQNEVFGVKPSAGANTIYRECHTFSTATSTDPNFSIAQTISSGSQDGKFLLFGSNWGGTLGAENGSASCTLGGTAGGTNCRGDVFICKLQ